MTFAYQFLNGLHIIPPSNFSMRIFLNKIILPIISFLVTYKLIFSRHHICLLHFPNKVVFTWGLWSMPSLKKKINKVSPLKKMYNILLINVLLNILVTSPYLDTTTCDSGVINTKYFFLKLIFLIRIGWSFLDTSLLLLRFLAT